MTEFFSDQPEKIDVLHVQIAVDYYERYMNKRGIGEKSPEATAAYQDYKIYYDSLTDAERNEVNDRIVDLERPDLAVPKEAPKLDKIDSDHPDIVNLAEMVDKKMERE